MPVSGPSNVAHQLNTIEGLSLRLCSGRPGRRRRLAGTGPPQL